MTNFDTAREALDASLNSSGSAMREHAKWSESLEARLNKLKSTWQSLSQTFMNSDFLKSVLDGVIGLVNGLDKLIDKAGLLPTLLTGFTIFKSFGNKGIFKTFNNDLDGFVNKIGIANKSFAELANTFNSANTGGLKGFFGGLKSVRKSFNDISSDIDLSAISKYLDLLDQGIDSQTAFANTMTGTSAATKDAVRAAGNNTAALRKMTTATNASKVGLIGAKAAAVAFNAALTIGISLLIDFAISGIMKLVNAKEELAEKVDEVTSKFQEQHTELVKNKSSFESQATRYGKLAKGVNDLGENVSLTADEYAEYQSIVNEIADQFPSLIAGYDEQGNALLNVKGDVKALTDEYEKLIHLQNQSILTGSGDIEDDFANKIKDANGDDWWGKFREFNTNHSVSSRVLSASPIYSIMSTIDTVQDWFAGNKMTTGTADALKELLNADNDKIGEIVSTYDKQTLNEIKTALEESGIEVGSWGSLESNVSKALEETLKNEPAKVKGIIDNFYGNLEETITNQKIIATAKLSEAFDISSAISGLNYGNISEELQNIAYQTVNSFDYDFLSELSESGKTVEQWVTEMLDQLNAIGKEDSKTIEAGFDLQTQFNGGHISYGEYVNGIRDVSDLIDGLDLKDEVKSQIKLTLNSEKVIENYDALKTRLTSDEYNIQMKTEEAEEFLDGLTSSEYQVAVDLIASGEVDLSKFDIDSLRDYIEKEAKLLDALNYTISIDVETESIEALNTAMAESVSGAGLSSEAIAALKSRYAELEGEGYNLSAMFEETANGIHLNKEAVSELEQKLASDKLAETDKQLEVLKGRYDELTTEIDNCTDAGERAALYTEQQSIVDKINDLATLASQYKGLTSAYNAWKAAEESGSERDMYEGIIEGFETVGDEISRGWADDGTIKFLELLTGKTGLASKSGKELKEIYDGLDDTIKNTKYSISDFFTVDEDGNSTNTGVYNFLNALQDLEDSDTVSSVLEKQFKDIEGIEDLVEIKDGNIVGFNFEVVGGDKAVADALGISEELVQIMVRAADDAGFVVNLEGAYTQLADLKTEAESARDTLISLQKNGLEKLKGIDVNFNLEAEGDDLIEEQGKAVELLNKFKDKDGKIDLKMEGAQQALDIAEYLTIKLDDLTEPKIMQIDVSEVDEDLREPIEKMQEIVKLSKEKHLVKLTGDTEELEEVQGEIDKVAEELASLKEDEKVKVGIDPEWDSKTIASKIEKGEIEIPAELELDVQMSDDLKDIRLLMMGQLGLADKNEIALKVSYDIDESTVDELTPEQQKVVVEFLAEDEDVKNYTPEQKTALVKYVADGGNLDGFTPEEKEAFVNYLVDGGSVEGYTPEDKKALAKYLVDGGDPDKYQPPSKTQDVTAELDSSEPDNYQPEDKKFTVKAILQKVGDWANNLLSGGSKRSVVNGTANVDGTAFANGTTGRAFKQGDWRTKRTETALTGELGQELVVAGNRWYTVGDNGAEFAQIPKGSIVFNHRQTEEIFKYGKVTANGDRGRDFASGTSYSNDSGGGLSVSDKKKKKIAMKAAEKAANKTVQKTSSENSSSSSSSGSGGGTKAGGKSAKDYADTKTKTSSTSKDTKEDFEETFDWIEVAISRVERAIDNLDQKANRTYKSWTSRNSALTSEISKIREEIDLQENAYNAYMKEADSVGLSSYWKKKVQDGTLDISTVKDENLAKKISKYKEYYEKAIACKDAVLDLKDAEAELYKQKFDNIVSKYEDKLGVIEGKISSIEQDIEQSRYTSTVGSNKGNYKKLISQENNNIAQLEAEKRELEAQLDKAVEDGVITKYSEDWYSMKEEIDSITLSIKESTTNISQYYRDMFDEVSEKYEAILQGYEHTEAMLNEYISQAEARGHIVSKKYYQELIKNEKSNISQLKKEQSALIKARDEAVASGAIKEGSAEWYEMCAEIDGVTQAIEEGTTSLIEYNNALRDIDWEKFDLKLQGISDVNDESNFLISLLSNKDLYDDKGKLTGQGAAVLGLHGLNHNTYMYAADEYGKEIAEIDRRTKLSEDDEDYLDPNSQDVIDRRRELVGLQRESILAAEDEKQAIKDLVSDGIDKELDALQELIDKKNESLESEKELYEYQKKVQKQTESIASLRKQMVAYENDDSEEAKAKIQELRVSLEDAEAELQETEWDKYISDTSALLDTLYAEYETILNTRLDNVDYLLQQVVDGINIASGALGAEGAIASALGSDGAIASAIVNAVGENGSIKNILNTEATAVGTTISTTMDDIWDTGEGNVKSILTTYGQGFQTQQTTTNTVLSGIKTSVDNMVDTSDDEAEEDTTANKTDTSAKKDPTKDNKTTTPTKPTTPTTPTTPTNPTTTGDGKAKVGDKVKFVSGKYYYDSEGKSPAGSKNQGKQVYITKINTKSWATHPYHISTGKKLGSGDLGWLKLNQLSGYATGRYSLPNDEWAWTQERGKEEYIIRPSDGAILTPIARKGSVLNAEASNNLWNMTNTPAEFIRDNLKLDASNIPNGANVQSNLTQHFENINFNMPNVKSYSELLSEFKDDPKFEKLILAMTINQIAGGSKLAKGKSIR